MTRVSCPYCPNEWDTSAEGIVTCSNDKCGRKVNIQVNKVISNE